MDLQRTPVNYHCRRCGQTSEHVKHKTATEHFDRSTETGTMENGKKRVCPRFQDRLIQDKSYQKRMRDHGDTRDLMDWDQIGGEPRIISGTFTRGNVRCESKVSTNLCGLHNLEDKTTCKHVEFHTQLWHKDQKQKPKLVTSTVTMQRQPQQAQADLKLPRTDPLLHLSSPSQSASSTQRPSSSWSGSSEPMAMVNMQLAGVARVFEVCLSDSQRTVSPDFTSLVPSFSASSLCDSLFFFFLDTTLLQWASWLKACAAPACLSRAIKYIRVVIHRSFICLVSCAGQVDVGFTIFVWWKQCADSERCCINVVRSNHGFSSSWRCAQPSTNFHSLFRCLVAIHGALYEALVIMSCRSREEFASPPMTSCCTHP